MAEATDSVHLTNLRTRRQIAIAVIARRAAIRETKAEMQRQGRKPATIPHRDIVAAAKGYLRDHPECFAEAQAIVARWEAEGFFRPRRAKLTTNAQRGKG
jgi:hypothetical protein